MRWQQKMQLDPMAAGTERAAPPVPPGPAIPAPPAAARVPGGYDGTAEASEC